MLFPPDRRRVSVPLVAVVSMPVLIIAVVVDVVGELPAWNSCTRPEEGTADALALSSPRIATRRRLVQLAALASSVTCF